MQSNRTRGIRIVPILALTVGVIAFAMEAVAAPVDAWVLEEIERDESVLRSAVAKTDGRDFRLLEQSTTYIPFFLETPDVGGDQDDHDIGSISDFFGGQKSMFLAGGYLYKIDFGNASPLYGLSSGEWQGRNWYSPDFAKDIEVNPLQVWSGHGGNDYSYASILSGVPPRLVVFDQGGEIKEERAFDISHPALLSEIEAAAKVYSLSGEPKLEMVSLAEYLRNDHPSWRKVEMTPSYNFRNQQERPEEIVRLSEVGKLTRREAVSKLRLRMEGVSEKLDRKVVSEVENDREKPDEIDAVKTETDADTVDVEIENKFPVWPYVVVAVAILLMLVLLLRVRKGDTQR